MKKNILHLCADLGSDSWYYQQDKDYNVIRVGAAIGVENFTPDFPVHGIIANPVCTEFSTAVGFHIMRDLEKGMFLVNHCLRIIAETNPAFWVIENPANGRLKELLGDPDMVYQPWEFGSPWTKKTALWGKFNAPEKLYSSWGSVPKLDLYVRPGRLKPRLAYMHGSAAGGRPEFHKFRDSVKTDADIRSLCSQGFARAFYEANK